jgi:hypothetical protein
VLTGIFPRNDNIAVMRIDAINAGLARLADGRSVRYLNANDKLADAKGTLEGCPSPAAPDVKYGCGRTTGADPHHLLGRARDGSRATAHRRSSARPRPAPACRPRRQSSRRQEDDPHQRRRHLLAIVAWFAAMTGGHRSRPAPRALAQAFPLSQVRLDGPFKRSEA